MIVPVVGETVDEVSEDLFLRLSNPTNASLGDPEGRGTIFDNDTWLRIWINGFIPRDVPGLSLTVPAGPYAGLTAIRGPIGFFNDCFLTDQRTFDRSPAASHRLQSMIVIDPKKPEIIEQRHHADESIEVDCEDGDEECRARATPLGLYEITSIAPTEIVVALDAGANNACFTGSPLLEVRRVRADRARRQCDPCELRRIRARVPGP